MFYSQETDFQSDGSSGLRNGLDRLKKWIGKAKQNT